MLVDFTGMRFGMLAVISFSHTKNGDRHWACKCECGKTTTPRGTDLKFGRVRSCGCYRAIVTRKRVTTHNLSPQTEKNGHPLYSTWVDMRKRCNNPKYRAFHRYGGRGIRVCSRWDDFTLFISDMGDRPANYSIDRIDNNGDYKPDNCMWATRKQQARNRQNTVYVEINGAKERFADVCERHNIPLVNAHARLGYGWCKQCAATVQKYGVCVHRNQ